MIGWLRSKFYRTRPVCDRCGIEWGDTVDPDGDPICMPCAERLARAIVRHADLRKLSPSIRKRRR